MQTLYEFIPLILFFIAYKVADIYVATGVLIAVLLLQVGWAWFKHGKVQKLQLITALVALVLGGITLFLRDPVFLQWKPTLVFWIGAAAIIIGQLVGKKPALQALLGGKLNLPTIIWQRLGWMWAGFMAFAGTLNIYIAYTYSEEFWVNFKVFGVLGLTFAFAIVQAIYLSRHIQEQPETTDAKTTDQADT